MVICLEMAEHCPKQPAELKIGISLKQQHRGISIVFRIKEIFHPQISLEWFSTWLKDIRNNIKFLEK